MAIKAFRRYEKKFIISQEQYEAILVNISKYMDCDKYCKDGNNYSIFNIYYDTDNNDVISHSISKPYYKEKLRLRSYKAECSENDKVFLEIKKKINGIVNKRRVVLTLKEAKRFIENGIRPVCLDFESKQVIHEIEYYLKNHKVKPKVYISYSRKAYFAKENKDFRLTFDSKIITRRDKVSFEYGSYGDDILGERKYLMEVKILGAMPLWFTKILSKLNIYPDHFSKYGNEYMNYIKKQKSVNDERSMEVC